jgi:hypothetical protein
MFWMFILYLFTAFFTILSIRMLISEALDQNQYVDLYPVQYIIYIPAAIFWALCFIL